MISTTQRRILALAIGGLVLGGCYGTTEPSFHPGDQRDILQEVLLRGIVVTDPVPGQTACDDPELVGNSLYFTARLAEEDEPGARRQRHVHAARPAFLR